MIPKVYFYYFQNHDIECRISSSLNELEPYILNDKIWPALIHLAFEGPLASSIREDLINSPKALFCSSGILYSGLSSAWHFNNTKLIHLSNLIAYPCEIAFDKNLLPFMDDLTLLNNKINQFKPGAKIFYDYALVQWEWSVRTKNVLAFNNIQLLSELVYYHERELLQLPNFGRKSLNEIRLKLEELGLTLSMDLSEYEITNAFDDNNKLIPYSPQTFEENNNNINNNSNNDNVHKEKNKFVLDFLLAIDKCENEKWRDILKKRAGFVPEGCQTLEQIGQLYLVTRERIRQIEAKALKKMRNYGIGWNQDSSWDNKINSILDSRIYPLGIDDLKENDDFSDIGSKKIDTLRYILSNLNTSIYILNELDHVFITRLHKNEFDKIIIDIKIFLSASSKKTLNYIYDEGKKFFPQKAKELTNKTLDFCLINSVIATNENNEKYLVQYSSRISAYAAAIEIFENSEKILSTTNIINIIKNKYPQFETRNVQNRIIDIKGVYPMSHGSWGMLKHLSLDQTELAIVKDEIQFFLNKFKSDQFHSREIRQIIFEKKVIKNEIYNDFIISAIIREFFDLPYLGRQMFATTESLAGKRILINEVLEQILLKNGKPMHNKILLNEANKIRSMNDGLPVFIKEPIVLLGQGYYGLDYWDEDIKEIR